MSGIPEKAVQKKALSFLEKYYRRRFFRRKIYAAAEVKTKPMFGGKRADGLLAFYHWFWGKPFVVSLEAKSLKTLPAIKPYPDYRRWLWNSLRMGFWLCLGSGLWFVYAQEAYQMALWTPLSFLFFSGLGFGILTWGHCQHQTVDVIYQLKQYPANEQWLAFSQDSYKSLSKEKQNNLTAICRYRGIGLLLVHQHHKIKVLSKPKRQWSWFWETRGGLRWVSDYLIYYSKEKEIRRWI